MCRSIVNINIDKCPDWYRKIIDECNPGTCFELIYLGVPMYFCPSHDRISGEILNPSVYADISGFTIGHNKWGIHSDNNSHRENIIGFIEDFLEQIDRYFRPKYLTDEVLDYEDREYSDYDYWSESSEPVVRKGKVWRSYDVILGRDVDFLS